MRRRCLAPEIVARAPAEAPVARVWSLLVDPARHAEWNPLVARVDGRVGPAVGGERVHVAAAGPLGWLARGRWRVPVDVALVEAPAEGERDAELGVVAYPLPGLTARARVRLAPLPGQRADVELRVRLAGVLVPGFRIAARVAARAVVRSVAHAAAREPEPEPDPPRSQPE